MLANPLLGFVSTRQIVAVVIATTVIIVLKFFKTVFKKPKSGTAIVRSGLGGLKCSTTGRIIVLPLVHRADVLSMDSWNVRIPFVLADEIRFLDDDLATMKLEVIVTPSESGILDLAKSLGFKKAGIEERIAVLIYKEVLDALRKLCGELILNESLQNVAGFTNGMVDYFTEHCDLHGLEIHKLTISDFQSGVPPTMNDQP